MNFLQNLGPREKMFVLGAGIALLLVLLFTLVIDPMRASAARLDRQITAAQRDLQDLRTLQRDYRRQKGILDDINGQLKRQKSFSLYSRLEELAGQTGIRNSILYIKAAVNTPSEAYEEDAVEVRIEGVTLEQLTTYLYQIENSPQFMRIKRLYIKPRPENKQILSAIFRVSTFIPKAGTS
jgi:general secretion pathway protein M